MWFVSHGRVFNVDLFWSWMFVPSPKKGCLLFVWPFLLATPALFFFFQWSRLVMMGLDQKILYLAFRTCLFGHHPWIVQYKSNTLCVATYSCLSTSLILGSFLP